MLTLDSTGIGQAAVLNQVNFFNTGGANLSAGDVTLSRLLKKTTSPQRNADEHG
jgi:hypothetical protein